MAAHLCSLNDETLQLHIKIDSIVLDSERCSQTVSVPGLEDCLSVKRGSREGGREGRREGRREGYRQRDKGVKAEGERSHHYHVFSVPQIKPGVM